MFKSILWPSFILWPQAKVHRNFRLHAALKILLQNSLLHFSILYLSLQLLNHLGREEALGDEPLRQLSLLFALFGPAPVLHEAVVGLHRTAAAAVACGWAGVLVGPLVLQAMILSRFYLLKNGLKFTKMNAIN